MATAPITTTLNPIMASKFAPLQEAPPYTPSSFAPPPAPHRGPLPALAPLDPRDAEARARRRRELMLDDDVLGIAWQEPRRHVRARLAAFYAASALTGGTVAIIAQWSFCRRRAIAATSAPCAPSEADFVLVGGRDGTFEACEVEPVAAVALEALGLAEGAARRRQDRKSVV